MTTERHPLTLLGCDFGAPRRALDQMRKIILVEARRVAQGHYVVHADGRNARLTAWSDHKIAAAQARATMPRPGWTVAELATSLIQTPVRVGAFDFPFGIPLKLLTDLEFARCVGQSRPFETHVAWTDFVSAHVALPHTDTGSEGEDKAGRLLLPDESLDFSRFAPWRQDSRYWRKRSTDIAARAQPPLKHVGQSLFAMTLAGCSLLRRVETHSRGGVAVVRGGKHCHAGALFETYPAGVARQVGFVGLSGSYKQSPSECMQAAADYLARHDIRLEMDARIQLFCERYRTGHSDPDGADALLCLISAICYDCGLFTVMAGDANEQQLAEEGVIVVPEA